MNIYYNAFVVFIEAALKNYKTYNQVLGDLNLFYSKLNDLPIGYNTHYEELNKHSLFPPNVNINSYISLEYNNALLFAALNPANILFHLKSSFEEKRYYFTFTAIDFLLSAKKSEKYKSELIKFLDSIRATLNLAPGYYDSEMFTLLRSICKNILDIAVGDSYIYTKLKSEILLNYYTSYLEKQPANLNYLDHSKLIELNLSIIDFRKLSNIE